MTLLIALLTALLMQSTPTAPPTKHTVNVLNGKGSGVYECGTKFKIEAAGDVQTFGTGDDGVTRKSHKVVFAQWWSERLGDISVAEVTKRKTEAIIACGSTSTINLEARYTAPGRKP